MNERLNGRKDEKRKKNEKHRINKRKKERNNE